MNDLSFLEHITFTRVNVRFEAQETIYLPEYKGSAFRGCMGWALRSEVCTFPKRKCDQCPERYNCAYPQLYHSFVEPHHPCSRKYPQAPHPYIINPMQGNQTLFTEGEQFGFELSLIGKAAGHLPLLMRVFERMGAMGIGKQKGRFVPTGISLMDQQAQWASLPWFTHPEAIRLSELPLPASVAEQLKLTFETPVRMKKNGKLLIEAPPFELLAERLSLRMALLAHFHCGAPWTEQYPAPLHGEISIRQSNMQKTDWRRYSGSQDTRMNFDGLTGQIVYEGKTLDRWLPLLAAGSWLHAGSTATFGLGRYTINRNGT